jgi:hypothetical protein
MGKPIAIAGLGLVLCLTGAPLAFGQRLMGDEARKAPPPLEPAELFRKTDANGDGKVDKAEFRTTLNKDAQPFVDAIWDNRDTNRDGFLSDAEMTLNGASGGGRAAPPARAGG